jgi:hypothetical protein
VMPPVAPLAAQGHRREAATFCSPQKIQRCSWALSTAVSMARSSPSLRKLRARFVELCREMDLLTTASVAIGKCPEKISLDILPGLI